jgi:hypothetical protein
LVHPPQLDVLYVEVSQPFRSWPDVSQFPYPGLHDAYTHLPVPQVGLLLLAVSQIVPQMFEHTLGALPMQLQPNSTVHAELQPSPLLVLPSSQPSAPAFLPSPHVVVQTLGCVPTQV